ncbi:MAG: hypothetical protein RL318_2102 [Fibrobacterota bacterium]
MDWVGRDKTVAKEGLRPMQPPGDMVLKAGALLFREGDLSRDIYLVREGKLTVSQGQGVQQIDLATLGTNSVIGEMSLLDGLPRSASVRAVTECQLMVIPPNLLHHVLAQVVPWLHAVLQVVVQRLRDANLKVNQHTIPRPEDSFARFLALKARDWRGKRGLPTYDWFPLMDEYCLCSRMKHIEVQKLVQILIGRGVVRFGTKQELIVPDPDLLEVYSMIPVDAP